MNENDVYESLYAHIGPILDVLESLRRVKSSPGRGNKDDALRKAVCRAFREGHEIKLIASRCDRSYQRIWKILDSEGLIMARKIDRARAKRMAKQRDLEFGSGRVSMPRG